MNKIRFYNPLTGEMRVINCAQGIMNTPEGKRVVSMRKVLMHMWSQGFVRGGRSVILSDIEKKMIEAANTVRIEMQTVGGKPAVEITFPGEQEKK